MKTAMTGCCVVVAAFLCIGVSPSKGRPLQDTRRAQNAAVKWILANCEPNGFIISSYVPALNRVHGSDADYTLQPLCLWVLYAAAEVPGAQAAAMKLREKLLRELKPVAGVKGAMAPSYKEKVDTLDAAMLLLALLEARQVERTGFEKEISGLKTFLLEAFLPTGSFAPIWPYEETGGAEMQEGQTQGFGLYCLARLWAADRSQKILANALDLAREFWSRVYRRAPSRTAGPWLLAAFATVALEGSDKRYDKIAYEIADYIQYRQVDSEKAELAEYRGGFPLRSAAGRILSPPTIEAARNAFGLACAWRLAKARGDKPRANRYLRSLLLAHAFIRSLQYNETDASHFRADVRPRLVGAFRVAPEDGRIVSWSVCTTILALGEFRKTSAELGMLR